MAGPGFENLQWRLVAFCGMGNVDIEEGDD